MKNTRLKYSTVALAIAGALTTSVSFAAETKKDEAKEIETIEVTGIRASNKQNLNTKRFANSIVDAISAEDVGKFPDANVADSLSRITGVGVSREFGEGEKITIRGSDPTKNRTLLNGQNVATADWFILDNPSRGFNFTLLPSSLVRGLEVHKSASADVDEGSIGGTVILRTRKPLELDAGTVKVGLKGQYSETSDKVDPQLDVLGSWKNEAEDFGVLVSVTKQDRSVQREGLEILSWNTREAADGTEYNVPKDIGTPIFKQDRERTTVFASLQYVPMDNLDVTLNILDSKMDANNHNVNLLIRPQNNDIDAFTNVMTDANNNIYAAEFNGAGSYEWDFINRVSSTETQSFDLDVNYEVGDLLIHAQIGKTEAKGGTYNETSWSFIPNDDVAANAGYDFDLSGTPTINTELDPTNGKHWKQNWTWGGNKPTTDEETFAQLDVTMPFEMGPFVSIKAGVKYRDHDRSQDREAYSWHWGGYMWEAFEDCPTVDTCGQTSGTTTIGNGVVAGNLATQLVASYDSFMNLGFGPDASFAVHKNLPDIWNISETILAGYVKGDFEGDNFRGNVGVRVVSTDQTASSYAYSGDSWGLLTTDGNGVDPLTPSYIELIEQDRSYTEVLPSFNISYDLSEDVVIRGAVARVMARPDFSSLSPIMSAGALNVDFPTGQGGNPNLKPEVANQFDVSAEYYFNEDSLLAATFFYKSVESYPTSGVTMEQFYNQQDEEWVDVAITIPVNGEGGDTSGVELSYQQAFGNFGVIANVTLTDASNDQARDESIAGSGLVLGASDTMYNVTAYYEDDAFSARVMYNYRTEWYKGIHWGGSEVWNDDYGQLDFSSSYQVTDNISLTLEALNLTDEQVVEFATDKGRLMSIYQNGPRVSFGANFTF